MEQKATTPERIKKEGAKHGVITQKMMSFKIDLENIAWLQQQRNKGRYLNELIARDRAGKSQQDGQE